MTAEVDFVIEQANNPLPVEVKSGSKGKLRSLDRYITELNPPGAYVLSERNVAKLDGYRLRFRNRCET